MVFLRDNILQVDFICTTVIFNESQNIYLALLLFSRDENDELNKNKRPNPDPISCPIPEKAQKLDDIPCAE